MIFDVFQNKLEAAGIVEGGKTLFFETIPPDIEIGVMIRTPLDGIAIDPYMPGWHKTRIQVITRHPDPVDGMTMAFDVSRCLIVEHRENYPATSERAAAHVDRFYPETMPIRFPRLEGGGLEISQYFRLVFGYEPSWK